MTKWLVLAGISGLLTYLSLGIGSLGLGMLFGFVTLIFLSFAHDEEELYNYWKGGWTSSSIKREDQRRSKDYDRERAKEEREREKRAKERSSSDSET